MAEKEWSAVLVAPNKIEMQQFDIPEIGPEEGLLKIEMCAVCGTDPKAYHGKLNWFKLPMILGHEVVGRIAAVGEIAARRWGVKKGDRVVADSSQPCLHCYYCRMGMHRWCENRVGWRVPCDVPPYIWGGYGEYQYLPPGSQIYKISESISSEEAVLINAVIANGIQWVRLAGGASIGDAVVIMGMGAQGMAATIAAKESGASPIIVTGLSGDEPRFELVKRFGADYTINAEKEDVLQVVGDLTGGMLADVVVEVAGSPEVIARTIDLVRVQGTVVCCSIVGSDVRVPLDTDKIAQREIRFQGVFTNDHKAMRAAIKLVESGKYPVGEIISHRFPLHQAEEALQASGGDIPGIKPIRSALVP
ncbi:zinc-binding dehydrogenase [Chloroflexota bacterium]